MGLLAVHEALALEEEGGTVEDDCLVSDKVVEQEASCRAPKAPIVRVQLKHVLGDVVLLVQLGRDAKKSRVFGHQKPGLQIQEVDHF